MTPNDKLPESITDQINTEADKYGFVVPYDGSNTFYIEDKVKGYQDGATAWAPWKVRFDELQAQAQAMADALDTIGNGPFPITQKELEEWLLKTKSMAREALQQFKDGKEGKQEPKPEGWPWVCEYCGKQDCGSDHK